MWKANTSSDPVDPFVVTSWYRPQCHSPLSLSPSSPSSIALYNPTEPVWHRKQVCVSVFVRVSDTAWQPRWECEVVRKKTLKEQPGQSDGGRERVSTAKRQSSLEEKSREEGSKIKCNESGASLTVLEPTSKDAMTRWSASTRTIILSWSLDRGGDKEGPQRFKGKHSLQLDPHPLDHVLYRVSQPQQALGMWVTIWVKRNAAEEKAELTCSAMHHITLCAFYIHNITVNSYIRCACISVTLLFWQQNIISSSL